MSVRCVPACMSGVCVCVHVFMWRCGWSCTVVCKYSQLCGFAYAKAETLNRSQIETQLTLCYNVLHNCAGRSASGESGWTPSWYVRSPQTSTGHSQRLCRHLTMSRVWETSVQWSVSGQSTSGPLRCTCLPSHLRKSKVRRNDATPQSSVHSLYGMFRAQSLPYKECTKV